MTAAKDKFSDIYIFGGNKFICWQMNHMKYQASIVIFLQVATKLENAVYCKFG